MILLKTDTVHREGSHCLSTLPWISNSHSQMCATPTGKASTQFHQCSLSPGDHFWEAHTTSCVQSSLQRGHWERSAGTLLFPPTEQGVKTHTGGKAPLKEQPRPVHNFWAVHKCTTWCFPGSTTHNSQNYHSPHY